MANVNLPISGGEQIHNEVPIPPGRPRSQSESCQIRTIADFREMCLKFTSRLQLWFTTRKNSGVNTEVCEEVGKALIDVMTTKQNLLKNIDNPDDKAYSDFLRNYWSR